MDMETGGEHLVNAIKKYHYVIWVVLIGVFLMLIPQDKADTKVSVQVTETEAANLENRLSEILSQISGVGKTRVLLTEKSGSDTIYQTDSNQNQTNMDTVIVTNENRVESGLVKQVLPPVYKGAIVVCQGADNAVVRLSVAEAVKSVTGLSFDCITVLRMK